MGSPGDPATASLRGGFFVSPEEPLVKIYIVDVHTSLNHVSKVFDNKFSANAFAARQLIYTYGFDSVMGKHITLENWDEIQMHLQGKNEYHSDILLREYDISDLPIVRQIRKAVSETIPALPLKAENTALRKELEVVYDFLGSYQCNTET
jgi:hypothetical protein